MTETPPTEPYQPPQDFSQPQIKPNLMPIYAIIGVIFLGLVGAGAYKWKQHADQQAIEDWIHLTPVNAMVLEKHPSPVVVDRFRAHFTKYFQTEGGAVGLAKGQLEMQQIININYLTDYIWTVKDEAIREYLKRQYFLITALSKQGAGLCEKYHADSSLYKDVDAAVGANLFPDFMTASEKLILSAADNQPYKMRPGGMDFIAARQRANDAFWNKFRENHPGLTTPQLQRVAQGFSPLTNCAGYAEYLRTLLLLDNDNMSIQWRAGLESDRPAAEARRRASGSE